MKWILILSVLLTTRCKETKNLHALKTKHLTSLNNTYKIQTLDGEDVSNYKLTISFDNEKKQASGFSGCNRYFGSYVLKEDSLVFGPLGSTRMMCGGEVQNIEDTFNQVLSKVNTYKIENDTSIKLFRDDKLLLTAIKETTLLFRYSTSSRGSFETIAISHHEVNISGKKKVKGHIRECSTQEWASLLKVFETVNLEALPSLDPPSKAHQYDGAPLARLIIIKNDKVYETQPFDHNNPHKDIAQLVKEILSIAQNIE